MDLIFVYRPQGSVTVDDRLVIQMSGMSRGQQLHGARAGYKARRRPRPAGPGFVTVSSLGDVLALSH